MYAASLLTLRALAWAEKQSRGPSDVEIVEAMTQEAGKALARKDCVPGVRGKTIAAEASLPFNNDQESLHVTLSLPGSSSGRQGV
jgi:hypothetical protein